AGRHELNRSQRQQPLPLDTADFLPLPKLVVARADHVHMIADVARRLGNVVGRCCGEGEIEAFARKDRLMERCSRREGVNVRNLAVVALEVRLVMDVAEDLAEVVPRQVRVDDLNRAPGGLTAHCGEHLSPHAHRGATVCTAHVGSAEGRAVVFEPHPRDCFLDHWYGKLDDVARARGRLRVIARTLHRHEAGGFAGTCHRFLWSPYPASYAIPAFAR